MTLLEYAYGQYDVYQKVAPYLKFKTFVESLERKSNKALIESISNGVSIIIEAHLGIDTGEVRNNAEEFKKLIDSKDKKAILGYALPILYADIQSNKSLNEKQTEAMLTNTIEYITDNWTELLKYDGSSAPSTFINTLQRAPATKTTDKSGTMATLINYPHQECNAAFEKDWEAMAGDAKEVTWDKLRHNLKEYGKIRDPRISPNQTINVKWVKGPNSGTVTTEDYYSLVFYDLSTDDSKTVSASTPLDKDKDSGGMKEDLSHTAAFAEKIDDEDIFGPEVAQDIDDAISIVTEVYEENGYEDVESLKSLIHDGLTALLNKQIRAVIAKEVNNLENNWKKGKTEEEKQKRKAEADKRLVAVQAELAKLDKIRENSPDKSTFGAKYGIKPQVAKKAWSEFVDVLKNQPTILNWIQSHR
jgi:hypothetical protein